MRRRAWPDPYRQGEPLDLDRFARALASCGPPPADHAGPSCSVLVDCTASDAVSAAYPAFMRAGLHVVTPNKKFGSGPLDQYRELRALSERCRRRFMYEVGWGHNLPACVLGQGRVGGVPRSACRSSGDKQNTRARSASWTA